jgi:hypothetical protein
MTSKRAFLEVSVNEIVSFYNLKLCFVLISERHCTLLGNLSEEKIDIPEPIRQYTGVPLVVIGYFICGGFHSGKNSEIMSPFICDK